MRTHRTLFVINNYLGDTIFSLSVLRYFLERHPETRLTVAGPRHLLQLFENFPQVETLFPVELQTGTPGTPRHTEDGTSGKRPLFQKYKHWVPLKYRHWVPLTQFAWAAGRNSRGDSRWDLCLDMRRSLLGYACRASRVFWPPRAPPPWRIHKIAALTASLRPNPSQRLEPVLPPVPSLYEARARQRLEGFAEKQASGFSGRPFVLIAPFAGSAFKDWPLAYYAELIRQLTGPEGPLPRALVGVTHLPAHQERVRTLIEQGGRGTAVYSVCQPHLLELVALCRRADLHISGDSGAGHLALAAGCRTLYLFGPTNEIYNGPWNRRGLAVRSRLYPNYGSDHYVSESLSRAYMKSLSVPQVYRAALRLMATSV